MKQAKRVLALLLAATLVSALVMTASAANTTGKAFSVDVQIYNGFSNILRREKLNDTSIYFYPQTSTAMVHNTTPTRILHVSAYGAGYSGTGENCTNVNGTSKDYVTCRVGTEYSIHSLVYQNGYDYTYLRIANGNENLDSPTIVEGEWSPDSTHEYTYAT